MAFTSSATSATVGYSAPPVDIRTPTIAPPVVGAAPALAGVALTLPAPTDEGGMPLFTALSLRHSTRLYGPRMLSQEQLSNLLWCAYGINRPSGERTAPYWRHVMVVDVYVATAEGVCIYDPIAHALRPYLATDLRALTGRQDFVAQAPVNLIYVAHGERMPDVTQAERRLYASVDTAFIGQNVYLFCASEGLATVFRGAIDHAPLESALQLSDGQFVTFAQTVGYPYE